MIVPMMIVHTIWDELKYGASRRLAPSSTAMTDTPAKNSVRYRNSLLFRIGYSRICSLPFCLKIMLAILSHFRPLANIDYTHLPSGSAGE